MSQSVKDAIAAELALLVQVVDFPVSPFGYGTDISCESDIDPDAVDVDGATTLALAQAIARRLDTPRGSLPDDKNYGIDVRSYCNRGVTDNEIQSLAGQIRGEVLKDDRVDALTVTVSPSTTGTTLSIVLAVRPVDAAIGGFTLTLAASSAAVLLQEIRAAL